MHGNCKCGHHVCAKILVGLAWLAAIGFWWADWSVTTIGWMDAEHLFRDVVILSLLAFGTKFCGCCWKGGKMMGGMNCTCSCGNCGGGKCGGMHDEGHRHM